MSRSLPASSRSRTPAASNRLPVATSTAHTDRLFRFTQIELPWQLGPPDGRYLLRSGAQGNARAEPTHVLVIATLGAPERRRMLARKQTDAQPEPEPHPVATGRATVIELENPFSSRSDAESWLSGIGEQELETGVAVLNRTLHAYRLVTADPYVAPVSRGQALVARVGYGAGEEVADGLWTAARELHQSHRRQPRTKVLHPQARLAAVLTGREHVLACEELTLRGRLDLDHGREREGALQALVALDAALAELPLDASGPALGERLTELHAQRDAITEAAQSALAGPLSPQERETVEFTLGRIEAALRARAVANA